VPGTLSLAVMLGRGPSVASSVPCVFAPNASNSPVNVARLSVPLSEPFAAMAPMPAVGGRPVATAIRRPASGVWISKWEKS
jgi:hypothetical protein